MTTLITGATGAIGASLVRRLASADHAVRAGSRDPRKAAGLGADIVELDLAAPKTFDEALAGVDRIFLYAEPAAIEDFVDCAERAGVRRVVLLSSDSVEMGNAEHNALARHHAHVEKSLGGASFSTTVLRPGTFATMTLDWASFIRAGVPVEQPFWGACLDVIHPEDIADVAERALTDDDLEGLVLPLGGPEVLSFHQQRDTLASLLSRELDWREPNREQAVQHLSRHAPLPLVDAILDYWSQLPRHDHEARRSVERITGRPGRTFRQWASERLDAFR
ncbi:NAD dependent epimerase/dehydratase [Mycolicibacterium mageritense DSM 44476 = CIP 104973]|uniref:NAD-dependent epimerase n=1 Tax=Mycolicibacterium mageritense TaxID=53462 RepID=A0ABM7HQF1_MYCME|nr:NAD(P)H-binding protein [Mycolicibacterium mageritense]MCC9185427.1 NAD(P)H-binding protein [Mycolicibacterium mageritense]BBX32760.1 NAD-dependent epimerase [Mycolicibacterium mageritense]CDO22702.1 NAD dependent epimerase/dehydratase [Mycolicibacterium mageritense DSM 44476 = CIP 104973]